MVDISLNIYDEWRIWIRKQRTLGRNWDYIVYGNNTDAEKLDSFLREKVEKDGFGDGHTMLAIETWYAIVESERKAEEEQHEIEERTRNSMLVDKDLDNNASISNSPGSAWQLYRKHLKRDSGFSENSVLQIEASCFRILKRLSNDTTQSGPIKGLVIGNVQSGKTANMAGLMAMAADNGWNMFIILSGTVENLREQTETRLMRDLTTERGNLDWVALGREQVTVSRRGGNNPLNPRQLQVDPRDYKRYFVVCLKNKTRLTNLIKWLQKDPNVQRNFRILIIDDEADQASVNTGDVTQGDKERKAINKLIVNLVEGRTHDSKECKSFYRAVNYVCYTATPYANFLNENYPTSLYPKDFLISLQPARQYFGPMQIFGTDEENGGDGMNIVRTITMLPTSEKHNGEIDEYDQVKMIHDSKSLTAPESLWDSLAWFICSVAAMRYIGYKKPISMLIHTSTKQNHHANFAEVIKLMLSDLNRRKLVSRCELVYNRETHLFTKEDLHNAVPDYERSMSDVPDYPDYEIIKPEIDKLLRTEVTAIPMDADHEEMVYHAGIHLCVDNCANNGINDENMHVRLVYPADDMTPYPSPAPAFIVIGGNTLSRGLTIQGLVSTYFARNVKQADSLMQMARWFGYRRNYELFPRLWMTNKTKEQFEFMTQLDYELRDELKLFHVMGKKPLEYGPRVKNSPKTSFLRITAKNRMQMAQEVEFDFTGVRTETITFPNNKDKLLHNFGVTNTFLNQLPEPVLGRDNRGYVWRDVDFSMIKKELLSKCVFTTQGKVFNQLDAFLQWIDKVTADGLLNNWNVAVAGGVCASDESDSWTIWNDYAVKKIRRNNKKSNNDPEILNVGAVRDPKDLIIDVDEHLLQQTAPEIFEKLNKKGYIINNHYAIRSKCGFDKNPLLIIYLIDKDSKPADENSKTRKKLGALADVVAFSITIPGITSDKGISKKLQIVPATSLEEEDEDV